MRQISISFINASIQRKKTLLVEYQQRNKTNQFVDRRFGEYDDELTAEEKMMRRFTLERKVGAVRGLG